MPTVNGHVVISSTIAALIILWIVHAVLRKSGTHTASAPFWIMMAGMPLASVVSVIVHGIAEAEGGSHPDYTENFIAFDIETGNVIASSTVQGKPFSVDQ